jgi:hypothetical protein
MKLTRSTADVRKLNYTGTGANVSLTLPKEVSEILRRAGIEFVRVTTTTEGILLTPYREPELPEWAKEAE